MSETFEERLLGSYILGGPIGEDMSADCFEAPGMSGAFLAIKKMRVDNIALSPQSLYKHLCNNAPDVLQKIAGSAIAASDVIQSWVLDTSEKIAPSLESVLMQRRRLRRTRAASLDLAQAAEAALSGKGNPAAVDKALKSLDEAKIKNTGIRQKLKPLSMDALLKADLPPKKYFIDGLLTKGLFMVTAREKSGKSWLMLQMIEALDTGGLFLDSLQAHETGTLYFSLESQEEDLRERLLIHRNTGFKHAEYFCTKVSYSDLDGYLTNSPACKVVIIDPEALFLELHKGQYEDTYPLLAPLKDIAYKHEAAIILIRHERKNQEQGEDGLNASLGSVAYTAAMDGVISLKHLHDAPTGSLSVTGRTLKGNYWKLAWNDADCKFNITGGGDGAASVYTDNQQEILDVLAMKLKPWGTGEIAERIGKAKSNVSRTLKALYEAGKVLSLGHGQWADLDYEPEGENEA
jgi:hypothetical protein